MGKSEALRAGASGGLPTESLLVVEWSLAGAWIPVVGLLHRFLLHEGYQVHRGRRRA